MTLDATRQANYYEVLGASPMDQLDRIEDLFRQLAYDAEQSGDHSKVPLAVEAFKVLRDPAKRHQYDQHLAHQQHVAAAQQGQQVQQPGQQVQQGQPQGAAQPLAAAQAQFANPAVAAPTQYQPTPSQPMTPQPDQYQPTPSQPMPPQPDQYQPTPSQMTPAPEQAPAAESQAAPAEAMPPEQPAVSIPNVQPEAAPVQAAAPVAAPEQAAPVEAVAGQGEGALPPPEFCAETAQRRRREVLAMFYKRRREEPKNPGIASGGIEQKVDYSYEVLEFHLWFMQQREWLFRLESGMFTITYLGVEEHEKNLIEGLIR